MKVLTTFGLFVTMTALLAGCSNPQNAIVGKWRSAARYPKTVEFLKDGTFRSDGMGGKYRFPDDTHITLAMGEGGTFSTVRGIKIEGDKIILTNTDNGRQEPVTEELHRVKE